MEFFKQNDFEKIQSYKGLEYDSSNNSDVDKYNELQAIYNKLENVCKKIESKGYKYEIRKDPRKQAGRGKFQFSYYQWARIYPNDFYKYSSKKIAFIIGVSDSLYFHIGGVAHYENHSHAKYIAGKTSEVVDIENSNYDDVVDIFIEYDNKYRELFIETGANLGIKEFLQMKKTLEMKKLKRLLKQKNQIILQGPPGTGKTYTAKDIAEKMICDSITPDKKEQSEKLKKHSNQYKLIQFHPAYTYEDFVRGIIAKPAGEGVLYEVENKTLAKFANDALENYQEHKMDSGELAKKKWLDEKFEDFVKHLTKEMTDSTDNNIKLTDGRSILKIDDNRFIYGNYEYLNFSEIKKLYLHNITEQSDVLEHSDIQRHVFYRWYYYYPILEKFKIFIGNQEPPEQKKVELKNFVLIIDEINRANLPAVLGELIYALEYRNQSVESMYEKDGDNKITLPENLYIIGTMNTADRSVGNIDYAIRRRFAFVDMLPKKEVIKEVISDEKLRKEAERIFDAVAELFHGKTDNNGKKTVYLAPDFKASDVQIGHSYFLAKDEAELNLKLEYEIKPILREYVKDGVLIDSANDVIDNL